MTDDLLTIGWVRAVTPGRRQIRIVPARGKEYYFKDNLTWLRLLPHRAKAGIPPTLRCKVAEFQAEPGCIIVTLTPGITRDQVALLKGAEVIVLPAERKKRTHGEYDMADLEGLAVHNTAGKQIGHVIHVDQMSAQTVLTIEKTDGGVLLTPAIAPVIHSVDLPRGVLVVYDLTPYSVEDTSNAD